MLNSNEDFCESIKVDDALVIGGPERGEKGRGDGEKGEVLDVWVAGSACYKRECGCERVSEKARKTVGLTVMGDL